MSGAHILLSTGAVFRVLPAPHHAFSSKWFHTFTSLKQAIADEAPTFYVQKFPYDDHEFLIVTQWFVNSGYQIINHGGHYINLRDVTEWQQGFTILFSQ